MASSESFENLDRKEKTKISSNRSFGFVFTVVFLIVAYFTWKKASNALAYWLSLSAIMFILALALPNTLAPLNKAWSKFGLFLHKILTPIIMFCMFYLVFTPLGFTLRVFNKLSLKKGADPELQTYWITRPEPGPKPESMKLSF